MLNRSSPKLIKTNYYEGRIITIFKFRTLFYTFILHTIPFSVIPFAFGMQIKRKNYPFGNYIEPIFVSFCSFNHYFGQYNLNGGKGKNILLVYAKFKKIANDLMLFYKVTVNPLSPTSEDNQENNKYHYRDYAVINWHIEM